MHVKIEKVAAWSGIGMLLAFLVMFWFIAGVIPPIDPNDTAAEVAARYTEDGLRIRFGLALMIFFAFAWTPFWSLLARQVRRVEGYWGVMSLTQALNDVFWFIFVGLVGPLITQVVILAFVVLFVEKRAVPSFPRWFGYFNIWYAILGVPGCAIYLFKTGPLAWNGIFAFWIPLTVFTIWQVVASVMLAKAVDVEAAEREKAAAEHTWEPAA